MAKNSAPTTPVELVDCLQKSGLLEGEQLASVCRELHGAKDLSAAAAVLADCERFTAWQEAQLLAGQFVLKLGDYILTDELGPWEFGRAFTAKRAGSAQQVTLKLLAARLVQLDGAWKETAAEIKRAAELGGLHLQPFVQISRVAQRTFLVTESEERRDVQQWLLRYGAPSTDHAARIIHEASQGLAALHEARLHHGCLRPQRLGLTSDGQIRLRDLGLARLVEATRALRASDATADPLQPPAELPPTQADLWCLGTIGLGLLQHEQRESHEAAQEVPTFWHTDHVISPAARQQLAQIFQSMADAGAQSGSARQAAELLQAWRREHAGWTDVSAKPAQAAPVTTPAVQTQAAGAAPKPAGASAPAVVIHTDRRRRRDAREISRPVTNVRRRERLLLIVSCSLVVLALLVIGGYGYTAWRANDPDVLASAASQPAQAPPVADRPKAGETEFPTADEVVFPTAEDLAALAPPNAGPPIDAAVARQDQGGAELPTQPAAGAQAAAPAATAGGASATGEPSASVTLPNATALAPTTPEATTSAGDSAAAASTSIATTADATAPAADTAAAAAAAAAAAGGEADSPPPMNPSSPPTPALVGLPAAVQLPSLDSAAGTPVDLIPIVVDESASITLSIEGGDAVFSGGESLTIEHADGGTAERKWDVFLTVPPAPRVAVAQLDLEQQRLRFQWLASAADHPLAGQLVNCALKITHGSEQHKLGLRLPLIVEAPVIDFVRGQVSGKWEVPNPPDVASCRLEILSLESAMPLQQKSPEGTIAVGGLQWLLIGAQPDDKLLAILVDSQMRRQLELNIMATILPPEELLAAGPTDRRTRQFVGSRDNRITKLNFDRWLRANQANLARRTEDAQRLTLQATAAAGNPARLADIERAKNLAEVDLQQAQKFQQQLQQLEALLAPQQPPVRLHFRLYFESGPTQIDLLRTDSTGS